jgi:hypothetical protein
MTTTTKNEIFVTIGFTQLNGEINNIQPSTI